MSVEIVFFSSIHFIFPFLNLHNFPVSVWDSVWCFRQLIPFGMLKSMETFQMIKMMKILLCGNEIELKMKMTKFWFCVSFQNSIIQHFLGIILYCRYPSILIILCNDYGIVILSARWYNFCVILGFKSAQFWQISTQNLAK